MNLQTWTDDDLQRECARYGFANCPLTGQQMQELRASGHDLAAAYAIACDVACGFPFDPSPVAAGDFDSIIPA